MDGDKVARGIAKVGLEVAGRVVGLDGGGGLVRLLSEPKSSGWDPVVPHDLHSDPLPPVAEDGTAECWKCRMRLPFAELDIERNTYSCRPCALLTARVGAAGAANIDVDSVKIGRGRWWFWPLFVLVVGGIALALIIIKR